MRETAQNCDFFCLLLAEMINLRNPLVVIAASLPWAQIEATIAR